MTEIPEHLLKRAAERRAAMSGGGDAAAAPADAPAAASGGAPAAAVEKKAAAPKGVAPLPTLDDDEAPAKPDIAVVAAAKRRKRIPFWAAPVLAALPLWGFIYYFAIKPAPAGANDPIAIGSVVYSQNCAGCHLANGAGASAGGTGQQLNDGHVLATFPDPLQMVHWISYGAAGGARANGTYGDPKRPGGAMNINTLTAAMPNFDTTLTPEQIAAVTIYVRESISGGKPADDPKFNSTTFAADPEGAAAIVQQVIDLKAGGDPDLSKITAAETTAKSSK